MYTQKTFLAVSVFFYTFGIVPCEAMRFWYGRVEVLGTQRADYRERDLVRVPVFQFVSSGQFRAISAPRTPNDVDKVTCDTNVRVTATDPVNTAVPDLEPEIDQA